jgi:hypothetical protein
MTQTVAAHRTTFDEAAFHEVRDPESGQLLAWLDADGLAPDSALKQALRHNGLKVVAAGGSSHLAADANRSRSL